MQLIFTPLAERHLDSMHEYITTHASENRADDYVGRIVTFCKGLTTFPQRGTERDDLLPGLRVTGFEGSVANFDIWPRARKLTGNNLPVRRP